MLSKAIDSDRRQISEPKAGFPNSIVLCSPCACALWCRSLAACIMSSMGLTTCRLCMGHMAVSSADSQEIEAPDLVCFVLTVCRLHKAAFCVALPPGLLFTIPYTLRHSEALLIN